MAGNLYVVVAPSGAGKTSLVGALLERAPGIRLSVSFTTREPRTGEVRGRDYHFVTLAEFEAMVARGDFLEHANVHGNLYGTSRRWIEEQVAEGHDVILEIDWQGAEQMRRLFPAMTGIFVLPPSFAELKRRLEARGKDSPEVIARRLSNAREEISHVLEFQYIIVNEHFEAALADLEAIIRAAHLSCASQARRLAPLLDEFRK